ASPEYHPARRPHPRLSQRPPTRTRRPSRVARPTRHLLPPLSTAIQRTRTPPPRSPRRLRPPDGRPATAAPSCQRLRSITHSLQDVPYQCLPTNVSVTSVLRPLCPLC